jgi:hypothetical protein
MRLTCGGAVEEARQRSTGWIADGMAKLDGDRAGFDPLRSVMVRFSPSFELLDQGRDNCTVGREGLRSHVHEAGDTS